MLDYLTDLRKIEAVVDDSFTPDPLGYFIVRALKDGRIRAEHYTTDDKVTTIIIGACAEDVRKSILAEFPSIEISHYGYTCGELVKAELQGAAYVQA